MIPGFAIIAYLHKIDTTHIYLGCIDKINQGLITKGNFDAGVLTFKDVVVPSSPYEWGTTIWIDVYSQCALDCGHGYWWKFEKTLTASQAYHFWQGHKDVGFATEYVAGTRVRLEFKGQVPCNPWQEYGC